MQETLQPSLTPRFAPAAVSDFLFRFGGKTPYGTPMYRMVLAETVGQWEGGEWWDWPEHATMAERGGLDYGATESGLVLLGADPNKPERVVVECRVVERYPGIEGWILERWIPPSAFGSKDTWEKMTLKSRPDIPLLGPFPSEGAYDVCAVWQEEVGSGLMLNQAKLTEHGMMSKSLREVPPLAVLEKAVMWCENRPDKTLLGMTAEARIKARLNIWLVNEQDRRARRKAENLARIKDHMKPYWSPTLEAGRLREELAKKAGIRSHVGN